jgi:hypothetical protein
VPLSVGALLGGLADFLAPAAAAAPAAGELAADATLPLITVTPSAIEGGADAAGLLGGIDAASAGSAAAAAGLGPADLLAPFIGPLAGLGGLGAAGAAAGGLPLVPGGTLAGVSPSGGLPGGASYAESVPGIGVPELFNSSGQFIGYQAGPFAAGPDLTAGASGAAGGLGTPPPGASFGAGQPLGAGLGPAAVSAPPPPPAPSSAAGVGGISGGGGTGGASAIAAPNDLASNDFTDIAAAPAVSAASASPLPVLGAEGLGLGVQPSLGGALNPGESVIADSLLSSPAATSASGFPISATATDPTAIGSFGAAGGGASPLAFATGSTSALGDVAPATGLGTATAAPAASSSGGLGLGNALEAGGLGLGALALLMGLKKSNQQPPGTAPLNQVANAANNQFGALNAEGQQFLQPSLTGQLPPGLEAQVTQALNDAIATTKGRYASLGLGNSTMASDQIAYLQLQAEAMRGTLAQQLAQTGTQLISQATNDLSISAGIYSNLMNAQIAQDTALETSVSQFAGSLALAGAISSTAGAKKAA